MKIMKIMLLIVALILIGFILALSRQGLFANVTITEKNAGPYLLVYTKHQGDYSKVGPVMDGLYYDLKNNFSIETTRGFGLFYDNPQKVSKDKLRSVVGCIVEGKTAEDLSAVSQKYGVKEYPASQSIVAEFPYKGKMSVIIGVFKVYPALNRYLHDLKAKPAPIMELYDQPNKKIQYIVSPDLDEAVFNAFLE